MSTIEITDVGPIAGLVAAPPDTLGRLLITEKVVRDFWSFVARGQGDECWLWTGRQQEHGYGVLSVATTGRRAKEMRAHRLSYLINVGVIDPVSLFVCHQCDVHVCVNPAHLFLGTARDNSLDMVKKGRNAGVIEKMIAAIVAKTKLQTHCKYGHPLSGDNLAVYDGRRYCITCNRARAAAQQARAKIERRAKSGA